MSHQPGAAVKTEQMTRRCVVKHQTRRSHLPVSGSLTTRPTIEAHIHVTCSRKVLFALSMLSYCACDQQRLGMIDVMLTAVPGEWSHAP